MNVSSPRPTTVKLAFEPDTVDLAIEQLVSLKILRPGIKDSKKYAQIRGSVKAIGLVEAPVVARNPDDATTFFLLDGHLRIECLKDLGIARVECLVSTDDETYTDLSPIFPPGLGRALGLFSGPMRPPFRV